MKKLLKTLRHKQQDSIRKNYLLFKLTELYDIKKTIESNKYKKLNDDGMEKKLCNL